MKATTLFFAIILLFAPFSSFSASPAEIEDYVFQVNTLRESLVKGVAKNPTINDFKNACGPVGLNIKRIAKDHNVKIRQATHKARNSKNKATKLELFALDLFKRRNDLDSTWLDLSGKKHFFKRITVRNDCLVCHGAKESRPKFITKKYPKDKAYGFKAEDLRGIYHVEL